MSTLGDADGAGGVMSGSRDRNRRTLVEELSRAEGLTSRQLVERTGLSRSTVSTMVSDLVREGRLVESRQVAAAPGRPAALFRLRQPTGAVGAVDVGHSHLTVALATTDGNILAEKRASFDADASGTASMDAAASALRTLMNSHGVAALSCIALGVPGPLELNRAGAMRSGGAMAGWTSLRPLARFRRQFGTDVPITVENDAQLSAIGEHARGAAQGRNTALIVKFGTGLGAGIIVNDLLYRGARGTTGEIGHVKVIENGELCRCGGRGCLETVASMTFALRALRRIHGDSLDVPGIDLLLQEGDPSAVRLFEDIGEAIGRVIAVAAAVLDPEVIVIGSALHHHRHLTSAIERSIARTTQPFLARHATVLPGALHDRAALIGAVARAGRFARVASVTHPAPHRSRDSGPG